MWSVKTQTFFLYIFILLLIKYTDIESVKYSRFILQSGYSSLYPSCPVFDVCHIDYICVHIAYAVWI